MRIRHAGVSTPQLAEQHDADVGHIGAGWSGFDQISYIFEEMIGIIVCEKGCCIETACDGAAIREGTAVGSRSFPRGVRGGQDRCASLLSSF